MTTKIKTAPIYRDLDLSFKPHPETGNLSVLTNENAIKQAVKNLVLTNKGERLFQPKIYSGVTGSLFDGFDPILLQKLRSAIRDVINNYEPRAELVRLDITDNLDEKNGIDITITLKPINLQSQIIIEVFLERIR